MERSEINILNNKIALVEIPKSELAGIPAGIRVVCNFYKGSFLGEEYVFVRSKNLKMTPSRCCWAAKEVSRVLGHTAVIILPISPNYERQRLLEKGVFFVMSDKYAFLPNLASLEYIANKKIAKKLTPVAQYLLLYHLQIQSLEGMTAKMIAELVTYSYESVTLGITCMADLALCEKVAVGPKSKAVHFSFKGRQLWDKALEYTFSPVEEKIYCDEFRAATDYPICGVNALSNYSHLNPDKEDWRMLTAKEYRNCLTNEQFVRQNPFDGNVIIEVWKYPAITNKSKLTKYVDRLSLALSMMDDQDPRIEVEIEYLIDTFPWKD